MIYGKYIFSDTYDLPMTPGGVLPVIHISQGETGRQITLLTDTSVTGTATIQGTRPDGVGVSESATVNSTGITWTPSEDFTAVAGDCECEAVFSGGRRSRNFILRVEAAAKGAGAPGLNDALTITENGTYGVRPYGSVVVNTPTPAGTKEITENGIYDISDYAKASVAVPEPTGTKTITENGTHDVKDYASAVVNVKQGITPTGTKTIAANGTYDVTDYSSAVVKVPAGGNDSLADFISRKTSGADVLDLMAYPIDTIRTNAFYGTRFSEIRIKANCIYTGGFAHMPICEKIEIDGTAEVLAEAFQYAEYLEEVHFTGITAVPVLANLNAFSYTPISGGSGKIFFPEALVAEAKEATNWNAYSDQIYGE